MNEFLSAQIIDQIIGVIDLRHGRAVHALAGDRAHYRPVGICGGNPLTLASQYRSLGATALYIADLDSISGGDLQSAAIDAICRSTLETEMMADVGWTGDEGKDVREAVVQLARTHRCIGWIAATESMRSLGSLAKLTELVAPNRVFLGLDYRDGQLIAADADEDAWVRQAAQLGCRGAVILDIANVGSSRGPTTIDICRRVKQLAPTLSLCSGGGIRSAQDVGLLIQAGCDRCLVATALHPLCG